MFEVGRPFEARYTPLPERAAEERTGSKLCDLLGQSQFTWGALKSFLLVIMTALLLFVSLHDILQSAPNLPCRNIVIRQEWRSLSKNEKEEYIQAVQCLQYQPSRLGLNQSLYHDFPYVHINVGNYCKCAL